MTARDRLKKVFEPTAGQEGVVLAIALLVMFVLLLQGVVFLTVSATENTIASNEASLSQAFGITEAGIEHARRALINRSPSGVLDGTADLFPGGSTDNLAGGSYTVQVTNNIGASFPRGSIPADSTSGSCNPTATTDCDRVVVVTSTGNYQNSQRTVEAIIQVPAPAWGAVYMMDGPDAGGPVEVEDFEPATGSSISGIDCNPPSAGGGGGPGPPVVGIAVQGANAYNDVVTDLDTNLPFVTGLNGPGDVQIVPDAMNDEDFSPWVSSLIAVATSVGTGPCGGPGNPTEFGTWANPQICIAQTGPGTPLDSLIPDGSSGAGILIVNDLDPNNLADTSSVRDFTYEGIIIVVGDGRFRLRGISRVYGAVVQKNIDGSHSGETRLRVRDDSRICYSSLAVHTVQEVLRPDLMAWYEK